MRPLAVDLFSGLGGWAEGLEAAGFDVIRVDIEDMFLALGVPKPDPCLLMLQDVLTLSGAQFKRASLIVASPPCQAYSYMSMPWSRAKAKATAIRADETGEALRKLNELFNACFRIQREASEAKGEHVPMVVENVRGAIPWVGRSRWNMGAFHFWGDVPALMPSAAPIAKVPGFRFDGSGGSFQTAAVEGTKLGGSWFHGYAPGVQGPRNHGSGSRARKAASARIAKIPPVISIWIGRCFKPTSLLAA